MARGYGSLIWCRRGGSRNLKVAYSPRCFNQPNRRCRADGDHAMKTDTTKATADAAEGTLFLGDDCFDPLEAGVRTRIRSFIEELLEAELDVALGRDRYQRPRLAEIGAGGRPVVGAGHGHRHPELMGSRASASSTAMPLPFGTLARKPAGQDPGRAFGTLRGRNSDALFPTEVQSLLNYLAFGQIRVANEMRKRGLSISPAGVRACGSAMISRR